ncbi:hypothetical protein [Cohnella fermenti]|uniref:hypothetical protein n=1 Tax=Cohnella fermenti TaxID=2565925 RepID=UPI001454D4A6|nr:hypothetical protein [Cohnella fermenti]
MANIQKRGELLELERNHIDLQCTFDVPKVLFPDYQPPDKADDKGGDADDER